MRYLGGKSRIARQIAAHLPNGSGIVYEPFCGGAAEEAARESPNLYWRVVDTMADDD